MKKIISIGILTLIISSCSSFFEEVKEIDEVIHTIESKEKKGKSNVPSKLS